jgi:hypothetical protein
VKPGSSQSSEAFLLLDSDYLIKCKVATPRSKEYTVAQETISVGKVGIFLGLDLLREIIGDAADRKICFFMLGGGVCP